MFQENSLTYVPHKKNVHLQTHKSNTLNSPSPYLILLLWLLPPPCKFQIHWKLLISLIMSGWQSLGEIRNNHHLTTRNPLRRVWAIEWR